MMYNCELLVLRVDVELEVEKVYEKDESGRSRGALYRSKHPGIPCFIGSPA